MTRLLSYYGDDFTGSTDAMEALSVNGVRTVLFTRQPTAAEFAPFTDYEAVGLAGTSRSQTPQWMDAHLPVAFEWLKSLGARHCHYKVCSTFDSSPGIGNIGRAAEIVARMFGQKLIPLIVGAPQLRRYTFAGNLFAAFRDDVYRIDRHPVMSRHPVTPMHEADLRLHLARQTAMPVRLMTGNWPDNGFALIDVHDAASQRQAGEYLRNLPPHAAPFIIGSSGVEYALLSGAERAPPTFSTLNAVERIMVVSGSVSPITERQIRFALEHGLAGLALDPLQLAGDASDASVYTIAENAIALIRGGQSVIAYTALGSASDIGDRLASIPNARQRIGEALGKILKSVISQTGLRRAVIAGGDSSSFALAQLAVHALTIRTPIAGSPGVPLCMAHSSEPALDGLEIAMKGGQLGRDDYFLQIRNGDNT